MQSYALYHLYLLTCFVLTSASLFVIVKNSLPYSLLLSTAIPCTIAVVMFYLFTVMQGSTVAQYSLAEPRASLWSLWVKIFLLVLAGSALSVIGNLCALAFDLLRFRQWRHHSTVFGIGLICSVLAFFTVGVNMPTE